MTSVLKVDNIQNSSGTDAISVDSNGKVGFANAQKFMQADGTYIDRPHFEAHSTVTAYNHSFTSANPTGFSATTGRNAFYPINNVHGGNTQGFNTSSSVGGSYYKVPVTGIYHFTASAMVNTATTSHTDMTFYITDKDDTFSDIAGIRPWSDQSTAMTDNDGSGARGFVRLWDTTPILHLSVIIKLFEGQHVRPAIVMNTTHTANIYPNSHNHWHGVLIG